MAGDRWRDDSASVIGESFENEGPLTKNENIFMIVVYDLISTCVASFDRMTFTLSTAPTNFVG